MGRKFPSFVPPTQIAYRPDGATTLHLRKCRLAVEKDSKWEEKVFDQAVVTLGSQDDNDIVLNDETVSRNHCRIYQEGSAYVLQDLGSTNGTFINQVRIKEAFLKPGCTIELGQSRLQFQSFDEEVHINPSADDRFGDIIGASKDMRKIFGILEKIAPTDTTIVIEGETGTGKEVVANTIHKKSNRAEKPFIIFDCSAVPANLIESELFGHEKGSFTGAVMSRPGLFELAHGGTVFLDELGELSIELQPKLLRVLETREVRRVGGARTTKVNVRVIAATNRSLEEEVRAGRFREDLFYRLSVVRLFLPALRERREDITLLAKHFLANGRFNQGQNGQRRIQSLSKDVLEALRGYDWPGNVRELLNVIERACSFADTEIIELADLPRNVVETEHMQRLQTLGARITNQGKQTIDELGTFKHAKEKWVASFERDYIVRLLERHNFNISHAARDAEIDRKYFRKLMKKYSIENPKNASEPESDPA
ncbi:MAG: sigma 54-interacting transcriptional regulator [Myxococcota bacterium]|nr:sigma 54-interacting transcriptional regulator [Myxococcota bacterium]